ncbi:hypothetical protein ACMU_16705 [Actibacterium mucosum KCTC 23349]|uniref:Immunity protein 30 domain-containing protein n=2 Tax=Actibacterium TaxID=1433986 RepID=A0A037ZE34_9RHOB|nr:hypothetical protein ACMU_16705 [Actibacterium mucosum KCTC 23349]
MKKYPDIVERTKRLSDARKVSHDDIDVDLAFVEFVHELEKSESVEIAAALLDTFDDKFDDGGVQEAVLVVLSNSDPGIIGAALCANIESFSQKNPEWLEVILNDQINENPDFIELYLGSQACKSIAKAHIN